MNLALPRFDLIAVLAVSEVLPSPAASPSPAAFPLPSPSDFASIGWLLVALWTVVKIADALLNFYKRHIKQSIPSGDWASSKDLEQLKTDLHNSLTEKSAYWHTQVHELKDAVNDIRQSGDSGREGLHNRLGTIIEVVAELRGENRGMVMAVKASNEATQLAANQATRAADRAEELARHNNR